MKTDRFDEVVNGEYAKKRAQKISEYCKSHKRCADGCVFWIGCCSLMRHPCDWDVSEIDWRN